MNFRTEGQTYNTNEFTFSYLNSVTPSISSISPTHAYDGVLTLTGSNFGNSAGNCEIYFCERFCNNYLVLFSLDNISISIGNSACSINIASYTQITCSLGQNSAGTYPVLVLINNKGYANKNIMFAYDLSVESLSSSEG